jgi:hypothetical protein
MAPPAGIADLEADALAASAPSRTKATAAAATLISTSA